MTGDIRDIAEGAAYDVVVVGADLNKRRKVFDRSGTSMSG